MFFSHWTKNVQIFLTFQNWVYVSNKQLYYMFINWSELYIPLLDIICLWLCIDLNVYSITSYYMLIRSLLSCSCHICDLNSVYCNVMFTLCPVLDGRAAWCGIWGVTCGSLWLHCPYYATCLQCVFWVCLGDKW